MSTLALLAGVLAPLAVVAGLAPSLGLARRELRRGRPGAFPGRGGSGRHGLVSPRVGRSWAAALPLVEGVGRRVRRLAGRPGDAPGDLRIGTAVLVALVSAALVSPVVAVPAAAVVWAVPSMRARSRRLAQERAVRTALPDTVDLFRLAVGAGLSVHQAVDAVAAHAPAPIDATLAEARRRVELGDRLGDALDVLDQLGDPVGPLAAALRGAARYGSPLGSALERVAADARVLRRRRAEEDARRLPVQLLFPLVLCVLPAFGLLAVVPLLLASLHSLQL